MRTQDPFDDLLQRHRGLLYTLSRRHARGTLEFDDLLQEATVALWRAREKVLEVPKGVQQAALVWKIGRNAIIDYMRRSHEMEALPEGYEEAAEDRSLVDELHAQIALLDEPDRTIVRLQLEGYSYVEIAERTGLSEKNVSVRLVRTRERLKVMMGVAQREKGG